MDICYEAPEALQGAGGGEGWGADEGRAPRDAAWGGLFLDWVQRQNVATSKGEGEGEAVAGVLGSSRLTGPRRKS